MKFSSKDIKSFLVKFLKRYRFALVLFIILCIGFIYNSFSDDSINENVDRDPKKSKEVITILVNNDLFNKTPEEKRKYLFNNFDMDNLVGDVNSKITVIDYSSFTCKFCKRMRKELNKLVDEYAIKSNKIRYVLRPLYNTKTIPLGAFINCARGEDKEKIADYFYSKNIKKIDNMEKFLIDTGIKFSMSSDYVKKCIYDSDLYQKIIYMQQETNSAFDIVGTPTLFINGDRYDGYKTYEELKKIIDDKYDKNI